MACGTGKTYTRLKIAEQQAGRKLGDLHVNNETVVPYPVAIERNPQSDDDFHVVKMKHPKKKVNGKSMNDESTIIYNSKIKVTDIPTEAYDYIVNGKAAIGWVMDRQCVKKDKASGIVNDANAYAIEMMGNAKYPLELLQRVITVSIETMKIVRALPMLDID